MCQKYFIGTKSFSELGFSGASFLVVLLCTRRTIMYKVLFETVMCQSTGAYRSTILVFPLFLTTKNGMSVTGNL